MEPIISDLVSRFEKGTLSRRELVQGLAMLAASGTGAAAAQQEIDFKTADIDHVSIQVADLQRSVEFYQKMFGFSVISEGQAARNYSPRHQQDAGLSEPSKPRQNCRSLRDRNTRFHQGICSKICDAAWGNAARRPLCRFARQGSRRDQRADLRSEMSAA